ncbi:hypothetical protein Vadar_013862 [Vaccinium darrowii]|uniref:Uncharacterized protein n=1 Tax=Vaccinium darrowii TaxID=229202 RepID=A0ACB7XHA3_9ERIC|nr:hypothetical protein Vadar_013862 [Vaccinium darrowii]
MELDSFAIAAARAVAIVIVILMIWLGWSVLNWVWLTPKKLEMCLRKQGLNGNSYRLLFGDVKESTKMTNEARSSPISLARHRASCLDPHSSHHHHLRFVPTKRIRRMKEIDKEVRASLRAIIDKRLKAIKAGEASQQKEPEAIGGDASENQMPFPRHRRPLIHLQC